MQQLLRDLRSRIAEHKLSSSPAPTPFVTLSWAQSLDGSISGPQGPAGPRLMLSGPDSMRLTHWLRSCHQAILVGSGTLLADNPKLTVRLVPGKSPTRVVLDSRLCIPDGAALLSSPAELVLLALRSELQAPHIATRAAELRSRGVRVLEVPADQRGRLDLHAAFASLRSQLGIESLMIEGGAKVIGSVVRAGLANHVVITAAPLLVGGLRPPFAAAPPITHGDSGTSMSGGASAAARGASSDVIDPELNEMPPCLQNVSAFCLGGDVVISGRCSKPSAL